MKLVMPVKNDVQIMSKADVAKFDSMLQNLHPSKRAGFVDSAHAQVAHGKIQFNTTKALCEFAELEKKHGFGPHGEKTIKNARISISFNNGDVDVIVKAVNKREKDGYLLIEKETPYTAGRAKKGLLMTDWNLPRKDLPVHGSFSDIDPKAPLVFPLLGGKSTVTGLPLLGGIVMRDIKPAH